MVWTLIAGKSKRFFLSQKTSRLALGPTQPQTQWVMGFLPWGQSSQVTTHSCLVLRLRMNGAIPLLTPICLHGVDRDNFTFVSIEKVMWLYNP